MRLLTSLPLLLGLAQALGAQGAPSGRVEGTIHDSVYARPLAQATVSLVRLDVDSVTPVTTAPDERGRFRFESLAPGRYGISFSTRFLDSLEFGGPARPVNVAGGQTTRVALATPSGATLRANACPARKFEKGTGAMVGLIVDADTDRPLAGAQVSAAWVVRGYDKVMRRVTAEQQSGGAFTDAHGQYRLCGLPTDTWLIVQVKHANALGSAFQLVIADEMGVSVRNLSFSASSARPADLPFAMSGDTTMLTPLSGEARLSGVVRGAAGRPVSDVEIRVVGASPRARTDADGRFSLAGLPAGTQELEVREVGYQLERYIVDLRHGRVLEQDIQLRRTAAMDTINVFANRNSYDVFETRRRLSIGGSFLNADEIARRRVVDISDIVATLPGYRIVGQGAGANVVSTRDQCSPNIVIGNVQNQAINIIPPSLVGAIEVYANNATAPREYISNCGVIVIWVKRPTSK